jgi:hypothetical protein
MTGGMSSGVWYFGIVVGLSEPPGICAIAFAMPDPLSKPNSVSMVPPAVYLRNVRRVIMIRILPFVQTKSKHVSIAPRFVAGKTWCREVLVSGSLVWVSPLPMRDTSGRRSASLTEDGRDVAPSVDPAQPDLAADDESEEQDERSVFGRQATLGLHTPAELLVQPLNHVCDLERLPLRFGKREERQQFLAPLLEAADDAGAAGPPFPFEDCEGAGPLSGPAGRAVAVLLPRGLSLSMG